MVVKFFCSQNVLKKFSIVPFILFHFSVLSVFWIPFHWPLLMLCFGSYVLRMFAITAGYHRYFSHRAFKTSRIGQFSFACLGSTAVQKGPLWWASHHRLHHKHSDQTQDPHSPVQSGFWWSHLGWILSDFHEETDWTQITDLMKFPELRFMNQYHLIPAFLYAMGLFLWGGTPYLIWGFFISTILLWHGTFVINSLAHLYGSVRYQTPDQSKNNLWLALITLGEGWHNNHHSYMSSARQGFFWWEIDMSYYVLKILNFLGLVSHLRKPPLEKLKDKLVLKTYV